jgi:hypothetical protein
LRFSSASGIAAAAVLGISDVLVKIIAAARVDVLMATLGSALMLGEVITAAPPLQALGSGITLAALVAFQLWSCRMHGRVRRRPRVFDASVAGAGERRNVIRYSP